MLARNSTLQSMKKAARLQVCTIVRSNAKKNISRRAKSKKKNQQNNDQTTRQTYKSGRVRRKFAHHLIVFVFEKETVNFIAGEELRKIPLR